MTRFESKIVALAEGPTTSTETSDKQVYLQVRMFLVRVSGPEFDDIDDIVRATKLAALGFDTRDKRRALASAISRWRYFRDLGVTAHPDETRDMDEVRDLRTLMIEKVGALS